MTILHKDTNVNINVILIIILLLITDALKCKQQFNVADDQGFSR